MYHERFRGVHEELESAADVGSVSVMAGTSFSFWGRRGMSRVLCSTGWLALAVDGCRPRLEQKVGGRERCPVGDLGAFAGAVDRRRRCLIQSGRVRGRPNRGSTPGSKRVIALIS